MPFFIDSTYCKITKTVTLLNIYRDIIGQVVWNILTGEAASSPGDIISNQPSDANQQHKAGPQPREPSSACHSI